ncbi:winged helix DNA-binding protein [Sphaerisporangium sp. NPDC088356]
MDRLVTAGLVERAISASDRRHVTLTLTAAGRQLADRFRTV